MEQGVGGSCHPNHCDSTGFYSRHIRLRAYDVIFTQNTSGGGGRKTTEGSCSQGARHGWCAGPGWHGTKDLQQ